MTTLAPAKTAGRRVWTRLPVLQRFLVPLASLLVALTVLGAGSRLVIAVALPALVIGASFHSAASRGRDRRCAAARCSQPRAGLIARADLLLAAGLLYLLVGIGRGWGVNRGRRRVRAWTNRGLATVGTVLIAFLVVYPTMLVVDYLAKPRAPIDQAALGLAHEQVTFTATDGVPLAGWYVPSRNGAAIVLVHGGGGDRQGTILHARMLASAGYGVLLYDARGRGESGGHENAFGWQWDRDVHGAVFYLAARGVHRIGLLGLSTGAEAVVTEAASDARVEAVVADGLQGRTASDASHLSFGDRISIELPFAVAGAEIELATGQAQPKPLMELVHALARTRPLLLIGTVGLEREFDRAYTRGTKAQLWELPKSPHTQGLKDHPAIYTARVLAILNRTLLP